MLDQVTAPARLDLSPPDIGVASKSKSLSHFWPGNPGAQVEQKEPDLYQPALPTAT
jgi:hypothetical protein